MKIHDLNCLLHLMYKNKDIISFDEIYYYFNDFVEAYSKKAYKRINKKSLYSNNDIVQESWLKIWLFITTEHVVMRSIAEFYEYLNGVVDDVIIELNNN